MKHFNDATQVLELLGLLLARCDTDEDWAYAVSQDAVRECSCVEPVLDVEKLFHALL